MCIMGTSRQIKGPKALFQENQHILHHHSSQPLLLQDQTDQQK